MNSKLTELLNKPVSVAPLVVYRIIFGLMLLVSSIRFLALGRLKTQYIDSKIQFTYYGFGWIPKCTSDFLYAIFALLIASSIAFIIGYRYRLAATLQFLSFTYIELLDKTYYLNHYYFVSIMALALVFLPAQAFFSLDALRNPSLKARLVPSWTVNVPKFLMGLLYFYAGCCKINTDWLLKAMPLSIWLPPNSDMPLLGFIFDFKTTAYIFSWFGMLYDLSIPFWLLYRKTRPYAYLTVLLFHSITGYLFQIGVFPLVMACGTLIFFSSSWHEYLICKLAKLIKYPYSENIFKIPTIPYFTQIFFVVFLSLQLIFPWRYLLYPGSLFWNEEGFRFSWRVMLIEKAGSARFFITNPNTGQSGEVNNPDFLNTTQEKQMSFQPDMILEYAHFLRDHYHQKLGFIPKVTAEVYVTLNGSPRKLFIDPNVDLGKEQDTFEHKSWILQY